jgi:hypothetical protein
MRVRGALSFLGLLVVHRGGGLGPVIFFLEIEDRRDCSAVMKNDKISAYDIPEEDRVKNKYIGGSTQTTGIFEAIRKGQK